MPLDAEHLKLLLEQGDIEKCVQFFAEASESERQSVAKVAEKWLREVAKNVWVENHFESVGTREQNNAGRVAVFATCSLTVIKQVGLLRLNPIDSLVVRVLLDRRPKWIPDFAEFLLSEQFIQWVPTRLLMRSGLCEKPKHDNYVLGMTGHQTGVGGASSDPTEHQGRTWSKWNILTHLDAEPDLLEDVWRLFEIEGGGEYSLATHDKYKSDAAHRWDASLVELSKRGALSRERLLDVSLSALDRGFAQFRAGWFSAFHELMKPTLDERVALQDRYLTLLASPIPPTVSFALAAIEAIDKERPLPGKSIVEAARPLMLARAKGTVKSGLKLLDKIAKRDPTQSSAVACVAAEALVHEASDVQEAALKLIALAGSTDDAKLVAAVTNAQGAVAASVRKSVSDWLASSQSSTDVSSAPDPRKSGAGGRSSRRAAVKDVAPSPTARHEPRPPDDDSDLTARAAKLPAAWRSIAGVDRAMAALRSGQLDVTGCEFDGTEFPRLDPDKAIRPIETLDELIDVAAGLAEKGDNYDEIERLFDGISRLCDQRPADFETRTGPLLKRVRQLMKRNWITPFTGHDPSSDMFGVILAWLVGEYGSYGPTTIRHGNPVAEYSFGGETRTYFPLQGDSVTGAMSDRARQLADRVVNRHAVQTLCAPTHAGGWIDRCVLADRACDERTLAAASDFEQVLALLRLAPDHCDKARGRVVRSRSEFLSALRFALNDDLGKVGSALGKHRGETDWLWIAATRARRPWSDEACVEKQYPDRGPDAGIAATTSFKASVGTFTCEYGSFPSPTMTIDVSPAMPSKTVDPRLLSVLMWKPVESGKRINFDSQSLVRQLLSIRPSAQESACSWGALVIGRNIDWSEARWHNRLYLEPLLDPDLPLRSMAMLLLVLGLAAKEAGEHGLATDVTIAAIEDGRLDQIQLGTVMTALLPTGYVKAARWAKTLGEARRVSPLHAEVIRMAIARSLRGDPKSMPKDLHALVELLRELVVETQTAVDEDAHAFLEQLVGTSKLGKAAKAIIGFATEKDPSRLRDIQRHVLEQRIARVERWMARK